jgi:hypothetical protein
MESRKNPKYPRRILKGLLLGLTLAGVLGFSSCVGWGSSQADMEGIDTPLRIHQPQSHSIIPVPWRTGSRDTYVRFEAVQIIPDWRKSCK